MGLLDRLFGRRGRSAARDAGAWRDLGGYTPVFRSGPGELYEKELVRSAVHAFAKACAKLTPSVRGDDALDRALRARPNPWQDTYKFLYRVATIYKMETTAFIVPLLTATDERVCGYYPVLPSSAEAVEHGGELFLRFGFAGGERAALELSKVGVMTSHQYRDALFGDGNGPLRTTLELIDTQAQGIVEGIKASATTRLLVRVSANVRPEDLERERKRFVAENLSTRANGGVVFADNKYDDVKQLHTRPYLVDAAQQRLIEDNVYGYFGVNADILQNRFDEAAWNAFYEGEVEPFATQLSLVLSNMTFPGAGAPAPGGDAPGVVLSDSRLQYATTASRLAFATQMRDRGMLSANEARAMFGLGPVPGGDAYWIRREYADISETVKGDQDG
ncbi:MAG: phage portal protein [Coriobacteriales bacterium]|jgi:hypothetical protein|nr:phage portal protein [Coriobacteriales bacterium]